MELRTEQICILVFAKPLPDFQTPSKTNVKPQSLTSNQFLKTNDVTLSYTEWRSIKKYFFSQIWLKLGGNIVNVEVEGNLNEDHEIESISLMSRMKDASKIIQNVEINEN